MKKIVLALLICSGCYTTKLEFSSAGSGRTETEREVQHTFFWGLVSPGHVDVSKECKGGEVSAVKSQVAGLGLVANWLTGGIWVPVTVKITCVYPEMGQ